MTMEEVIQFDVKHNFSLAIHGKRESLDKILTCFPYNYILELNNEIEYQVVFGHQVFKNVSAGDTMDGRVPPSWYSEFCAYCKEHAGENCVLLIRGITRCEPSKQVWLNSLVQERMLHPELGPLPENSAIVLLVEEKEEADYEFYNITEQLFRRLSHFFLDKNK